jgi:enamine deaminase RidA (YjgF/YER057c/UK114 family)
VANVDRVSGEVLPTYAPVLFENATRPTRVNLEVAGLPRPGWLVEIEVVAAFPV